MEPGQDVDVETKMNLICALEESSILQSQNYYIRSLQSEIDRLTERLNVLLEQIRQNDSNYQDQLQQFLANYDKMQKEHHRQERTMTLEQQSLEDQKKSNESLITLY